MFVKQQRERTITVLCDYYLPGHRAGGPIHSISAIVENLGSEFNFRVITRDRDLGQKEPYTNKSSSRPDVWSRVGAAEVAHVAPLKATIPRLRRLLCESQYDLLYINSVFSPRFAIQPLLLRYLRLVPDRPTIVAPRGELMPRRLALKAWKKRFYLGLSKALGLHRNVVWQATSENEAGDIAAIFGPDARISIVANARQGLVFADPAMRHSKKENELRAVFLGRISQEKNLDYALRVLSRSQSSIAFDIYGEFEPKYWEKCEATLSRLPGNVKVKYCGHVMPSGVGSTLAKYDLFLLPTLGENYGHSIVEAMAAGCAVLVSKDMPWTDLEERGAGWVVPLERPSRYLEILEKCASMSPTEFAQMSMRAQSYARSVNSLDNSVKKMKALFAEVLSADSWLGLQDG